MIKTGGGAFDPHEEPIYFPAANASMMRIGPEFFTHVLTAINDLETPEDIARIENFISKGIKVFVDSGVFNLTNEHMRAHGCTMDEALALAPEQIDGFDKLFTRYVAIVRQLDARCWGYIELDQGGRENKKRTRAKLEAMGLRPIPVYHPLNDGWDYFDELAENYDRICFANIVQASTPTRLRLLATMWERHRKYPHLWIHVLGLTPNRFMAAFPANSCDSSTWVGGVRWGQSHEFAALKTFGQLGAEFISPLGAKDKEYETLIRVDCTKYSMLGRSWRNMMRDLRANGLDIYGMAK